MVDDSTQELASGIDLSSPRRRVSKCSRVSLFASEESRRKSHQESTFDITPEVSTVQEEEGTSVAAEDDNSNKQFCLLHPHSVKQSRSIGPVIMIEYPREDQIATDTSINATPSTPATTKSVGPSLIVAHEITDEAQATSDTSAGTSS